MTTARISRRKGISQRTIATTVIVALIVLLIDLYSTHARQKDQATDAVALASLPAVTVAEPEQARPPYKRETYQPHGWIDADGNGCNTRREVLIQESTKKPSINPDGCKISGGEWKDRFSPKFNTTNDQDVQIDHLVALADADRSGAWKWPSDKKLAFANNLDNPDELNAISNALNNEKSDKGPDEWMPGDKNSRCKYLQAYVTIKSEWQLTVSPAQWNAIAKAWPNCLE